MLHYFGLPCFDMPAGKGVCGLTFLPSDGSILLHVVEGENLFNQSFRWLKSLWTVSTHTSGMLPPVYLCPWWSHAKVLSLSNEVKDICRVIFKRKLTAQLLWVNPRGQPIPIQLLAGLRDRIRKVKVRKLLHWDKGSSTGNREKKTKQSKEK